MKYCLVIDDSPVIRKVARRILEGVSFEIGEAEDGRQALASCADRMPDAIIVDSTMPEMDGHEFVRTLRKTPGGDKPKIVYCATENDVAFVARALHAGANEYMMKPFDREMMLGKLREAGLIG